MKIDLTPQSDTPQVALELARAISQQDEVALQQIYADDIVVWHNSDSLTQTKAQNLANLHMLFELCSRVEYEDVRCYPIESGFVQQHQLAGESRAGQSFSIPACLVVKVRNGQIVRLDEYIDPSALLAML
jgi:ketosteroid isomerase-like protein